MLHDAVDELFEVPVALCLELIDLFELITFPMNLRPASPFNLADVKGGDKASYVLVRVLALHHGFFIHIPYL